MKQGMPPISIFYDGIGKYVAAGGVEPFPPDQGHGDMPWP
jgi:hypothetical protein